MTTRKLNELDFMMMDVHRPLTNEEIAEVNPEALVDKSARPLKIVDYQEEGVGASHTCESTTGDRCDICFGPTPKRYAGPFVKYPDNVEVLDVNTSHELDVERVLQAAFDNKLDSVLVIGQCMDGGLFFLCSDPALAEANLLCDLAKAEIMEAVKNNLIREKPVEPKDRA